MTENRDYFQLLALQILLLPVCILVISSLGFCIGVPLTRVHFILGFISDIALSFVLVRLLPYFKGSQTESFYSIGDFIKITALFVLLIILSSLISIWVYDFSYDGQTYHQSAVIALANGWNPFHEPFVEKYNPEYKRALLGNELYVDHYTKASWMTAASIYRLTGRIEAGKMFNFLYILAAFLVTLNFLRHFGRIPEISKLIISALVALNPVSLYQMWSFYNDGQMASLMSMLLVLAFQYIMFREDRTYIFLFPIVVIISNIKFTGLFYSMMIMGMSWLTVFIIDRDWQRRFGISMGVAFVIAFLFIGFQPYVTNLIYKGNIVYPAVRLEGGKIETVLNKQAPPAFLKKDRFSKLVYSVFSSSDNASNMPRLKVPFSIGENEMKAFNVTDARYGGFGPLFGSILLLVLVVMLIVAFKLRRIVWLFSFIPAMLILLVTLLSPESWWARLSPQLWLLPITFIVTFYYFPNEYVEYFRGFILSILLLNCVLVFTQNTNYTLETNIQFRRQIAALADASRKAREPLMVSPGPFYLSTQNRLRDFHIRYRMTVDPEGMDQKGEALVGTPEVKIRLGHSR
ncbi:MAG: hypothetical protein ACM3SY_05955 [Candidatus Omnitrophota bacterium]